MRHVDEGTIHAWLDGEIADPGETAWIDEHLRWCAACGTRVAEERATREQAHALLAIASPAAEPPAFHQLAARAEKETPSASERTAEAGSLQRSRWFLQVGWAASIILAATIGWTAREVAERDSTTSVVLAPSLDEIPAVGARNPSANTATSTAPAQEAQAAGQSALRERRPGVPADKERRPGVPADTAPPREATQSTAIEQQLDRLSEQRQRFAGGRAGETAVPFVSAPPPPAALGQSAAITVPQAPQSTAEARRSAPAPLQETVTVTGASPAGDVATARTAETAEWQMVPRTEAAARSGMALYGIDGLEPVSTSISADRRIVRTVYRLESGAAVDLEQERVLPNAAATISSLQATTRGLTSAGRAGPTAGAAQARVWSEVRSGFRVLLRTTSDAADLTALGAKLRVD